MMARNNENITLWWEELLPVSPLSLCIAPSSERFQEVMSVVSQLQQMMLLCVKEMADSSTLSM